MGSKVQIMTVDSIFMGVFFGYPHKPERFYSQVLTGAASLSRLVWIAYVFKQGYLCTWITKRL